MLSWLAARHRPEKIACYAQADRLAQVAAMTDGFAELLVEQQQGFHKYLLDGDSQVVRAGVSP